MFADSGLEPLVTTAWLVTHLDEPDIAVIEMDTDDDQYAAGHIPGSQFWNTSRLMSSNYQLVLDTTNVAEMFSAAGINNDSTVVLVSGRNPAASGWLFWYFKLFGHRRVSVLDGGRQKWLADGFSVTRSPQKITRSDYRVSRFDHSIIGSAELVESVIARESGVILDVRSEEEFTGDFYVTAPPKDNEIAGHIPGARHLDYRLVHNQDGTFKEAGELGKLFSSQGVSPDRLTIPYCAVGARSAHIWFVLTQLLGFKEVVNYAGSWAEWSKRENGSNGQ